MTAAAVDHGSYGVLTNKISGLMNLLRSLKVPSQSNQVRLVENENGSSKSSKSSVRRKANQRFDGLTQNCTFCASKYLLDPHACILFVKEYQRIINIVTEMAYIESFVFAGIKDIDEKTTVVPSKANLFEYTYKRKSLERLWQPNRDLVLLLVKNPCLEPEQD